MPVLDETQRLLAVLTHLSDGYDGLSGQWYMEAKFGVLEGLGQPTYPDLDAAQEAIAQHLAKRHRDGLQLHKWPSSRLSAHVPGTTGNGTFRKYDECPLNRGTAEVLEKHWIVSA